MAQGHVGVGERQVCQAASSLAAWAEGATVCISGMCDCLPLTQHLSWHAPAVTSTPSEGSVVSDRLKVTTLAASGATGPPYWQEYPMKALRLPWMDEVGKILKLNRR